MVECNFEDHSLYSFDISAVEIPQMIVEKEKGNEVGLGNKILSTK